MQNSLLDSIIHALATAFRVPPDSIDIDGDLLDVNGYNMNGRVLDSLELVEMITVVEEALGFTIDNILETNEKLSLRSLCEQIASIT